MSVKDEITPGPWNTYADNPADSVYCDDELGNRVANCENYMLPVEQRKANAKAISKVPEMLDIIERLAEATYKYDCKECDVSEYEQLKQDAINLLKQLNQ